jgi:hypothetical protein
VRSARPHAAADPGSTAGPATAGAGAGALCGLFMR